jgi:hypothetical protein
MTERQGKLWSQNQLIYLFTTDIEETRRAQAAERQAYGLETKNHGSISSKGKKVHRPALWRTQLPTQSLRGDLPPRAKRPTVKLTTHHILAEVRKAVIALLYMFLWHAYGITFGVSLLTHKVLEGSVRDPCVVRVFQICYLGTAAFFSMVSSTDHSYNRFYDLQIQPFNHFIMIAYWILEFCKFWSWAVSPHTSFIALFNTVHPGDGRRRRPKRVGVVSNQRI